MDADGAIVEALAAVVDLDTQNRRPSRWRSVLWTFFLVPFLVLPYRWLWLPCALGLSLLFVRGRPPWKALQLDGTLMVGAPILLLVRTLLDPGWWVPWVVVIVAAIALRRRYSIDRHARLAIVACWLLALALLLRPSWPVGHPPSAAVSPESILVCAGDSLTAGVDLDSDRDTYVARLRQRLGCQVINAGVADNEAKDLQARLERDVLAHKLTVVLVMIGGNDYLHGGSREDLATALDDIVGRITGAGARVVLVEVPSGIIWNPFAGVSRSVAKKYGAILVPETYLRLRFMIELVAREHLREPLTIDGIHLSPAGATDIARWLEPFVIDGLRPASSS